MKKNPYPGKFIVFEGLDGSGQSTQAKLLKDFLIKKGYKVHLTKEPTTNSKVAPKIRKALNKLSKISPQTLQELFAQDREEHLKEDIIPALKEDKFVISDRYFFSSFAYGGADGLDLNWLIKINNEFLLPDLTFILKVRPKICLQRIINRGREKTLFERESILEKVFKNYLSLARKFKNVYIIDGERPIKEVASQIQKVVLSKLNF